MVLINGKHISFFGAGLAPMAGAADSAFRALCMEHGASWCVSEMISAKALTFGDKKTYKLMERTEAEAPYGIQLFGHEPDIMAEAARIAQARFSPDFIDINMGCPAPKITGSGSGSALLRDIPLACRIISAVDSAVKLPVTVKLRTGYDVVNCAESAKALEAAGAAAIAVHGRLTVQMYRPPVDLGSIRLVRDSVSVPVIGNGDVCSGSDALRMLAETGCNAVLIGRGALGNPFIFDEVNAALAGREPASVSLGERLAALRRQTAAAVKQKGEYIALQEARKHAAWYIKGFYGAAKLRGMSSSLLTMDDLDCFISEAQRYAASEPS